MRSEKIIQGKRCRIYKSGETDSLLIQPVDEHDMDMLDKEVETINKLAHTPFALAAFLVDNWGQDLSPWEAPAVFGKEDFGSGAAETLSFITGALLPELNVTGNDRCYIGGYSLAGLFSLWAAYQTDIFCGAAAVSPSVWFPGWDNYMETNSILSRSVYLSLGDREEKTRNKVMASVGKNILRQHELLRNTDTVTSCVLEWNPGNHFTEPEKRTAKGFAWLLNGGQHHE